jgi:hypothetical protein
MSNSITVYSEKAQKHLNAELWLLPTNDEVKLKLKFKRRGGGGHHKNRKSVQTKMVVKMQQFVAC